MKKRKVNIDLLRTICIFSVIFIHVTANFMVENYPSQDSRIILIISIFTSCAVPLFYMLSGAFLINEKNTNIKKTVKKAGYMYLQIILWTIIYQIIFKYIQHQDINLIKTIIKSFTSSQVGHFWFMYPLIGIYILLPFISRIYLGLNENEKKYLILLLCIIPTIISTFTIKYNELFTLPYFSVGFPEIGIFILGKYLFDKEELRNKKALIISLIFIAIGFCLIKLVSDFYINNQGINYSKPYFDYNKLPNLIMIIGIFITMLNIEGFCKKIPISCQKWIEWIGSNTLGIYLIHMIFIYIFPTIKIGNIYMTSNSGHLYNMLLGCVFYFVISILGVLIISRIPFLNRMIK